MILYLLKRLGTGLVCLVLVTLFVFIAMRLVPGDFVTIQLQNATGVTEEQANHLRDQFGLNDPVQVQLFNWIAGVFQGDLGTSFWIQRPVADVLAERIPVTLQMGLMAISLAVIAGLALGILGARRRGSWLDGATRVGAVVGLSVPHYIVALLLLVTLVNLFKWSPPLLFTPLAENPGLFLQQIWIPVLALAAMMTAAIARMTRAAMLESLGSESIRAVRARGGGEGSVLLRHGLRNAGIPIITIVGLEMGAVLGGTVILEAIFNIQGIGALTYDAVTKRDYPLVVICTIFYCIISLVVAILVDLAYAIIDPRIRKAGVGT